MAARIMVIILMKRYPAIFVKPGRNLLFDKMRRCLQFQFFKPIVA